jgi:hypothetical protein
MAEVLPVPNPGDVFQDVRADQRTMRVSFHQREGTLVVSLWSGGLCRASFRLAAGEIGRLSTMLAEMARKMPAEPETGRETESGRENESGGDDEPDGSGTAESGHVGT